MASTEVLEHAHFVKGIDPASNAFAGTVASDIVNMSHYNLCTFIIHVGVGATGTSTLTVEACDDVSATNVSAIPFWYRQILTGDTEGTMTAATSAGFTTTAGSSKIIVVEVSANDLAASGYKYVRLQAVEVVANAVLGGILIMQSQPRYAKSVKVTSIV